MIFATGNFSLLCICSYYSFYNVAMQFKFAGIILTYAFGSLGNKFMILGALVVIIYSALEGIRAVIMTDIVQLLTFTILYQHLLL